MIHMTSIFSEEIPSVPVALPPNCAKLERDLVESVLRMSEQTCDVKYKITDTESITPNKPYILPV